MVGDPLLKSTVAASVVAFWWNRDTLPLWAKAAPSAATKTTGAGTARRPPVTAVGWKAKGENSQDLFAVVKAVALDGWEPTPGWRSDVFNPASSEAASLDVA